MVDSVALVLGPVELRRFLIEPEYYYLIQTVKNLLVDQRAHFPFGLRLDFQLDFWVDLQPHSGVNSPFDSQVQLQVGERLYPQLDFELKQQVDSLVDQLGVEVGQSASPRNKVGFHVDLPYCAGDFELHSVLHENLI